jgi:hypothetical protein
MIKCNILAFDFCRDALQDIFDTNEVLMKCMAINASQNTIYVELSVSAKRGLIPIMELLRQKKKELKWKRKDNFNLPPIVDKDISHFLPFHVKMRLREKSFITEKLLFDTHIEQTSRGITNNRVSCFQNAIL